MCGIILSATKKSSIKNLERVKLQYKDQDHRGKSGFGFVAVKDGSLIHARSTTEKSILEELERLGETSFIMFHHRIPTCNLNAVKANHPFFVASKKNLDNKYYVCHNGRIENTDALKKEHEEVGFRYRTTIEWQLSGSKVSHSDQTDSESLGIEIAKFIEGKTGRIKARGTVATFVLQTTRDNEPLAFYFFRDGNPIKFYRNEGGILLASEAKGLDVEQQMLFRLDLKTWEVSSKPAKLSLIADIGTKEEVILPFVPLRKLTRVRPVMLHTHDPVVIAQVREQVTNLHVIPSTIRSMFPERFSVEELETRLKIAHEKLWGIEGDIAEFEDNFGAEHRTEQYDLLLSDRDGAARIVGELRDKIAYYSGAIQV